MVDRVRVCAGAGLLASSLALVGGETLAIVESGGLKFLNPEYLSASLGNSLPLAYGFIAFYATAMAGGIYGIAWSGRILYREISGAVRNYRARRAAKNSAAEESGQSILERKYNSDVSKPHSLSTGFGLPHFFRADSGETFHHTLEED